MPSHYDRKKAVKYAREWALSTNPKYGRLEPDCTNFTSQILHEAGWPMVGSHNALHRASKKEWWFGGSLLVKASHSWGGAHNFSQFLAETKWATRVKNVAELDAGDIVQIAKPGTQHITHSMFVSERTGADLLVCYHSYDVKDRPLSKANSRPEDWVLWKMNDHVLE